MCKQSLHHLEDKGENAENKRDKKVKEIFKKYDSKIQKCFVNHLDLVTDEDVKPKFWHTKPNKVSIEKELTVILDVDSKGELKAISVNIERSSSYSSEVASCVEELFKNISFCPGEAEMPELEEISYLYNLDSQSKHDDVEICKSSCSYAFSIHAKDVDNALYKARRALGE